MGFCAMTEKLPANITALLVAKHFCVHDILDFFIYVFICFLLRLILICLWFPIMGFGLYVRNRRANVGFPPGSLY